MSEGFSNQSGSFLQKVISFAQEQAQLITNKTGIPAKYIIIALAVCVASVMIGYLDQYVTCLVGIVIPSICSIRALETKEIDDDKQWLTYWIVYGLFSFIDLFSGFILKYIPFYFIIKILFLLWLFLPTFMGASVIYNKIIIKLFNKYKPQIDELEHTIGNKANDYMGRVQENVKIPGANQMGFNLQSNPSNNANNNFNINAKI